MSIGVGRCHNSFQISDRRFMTSFPDFAPVAGSNTLSCLRGAKRSTISLAELQNVYLLCAGCPPAR